MINSERQALSSPIFLPKVIRTRRALLQEIIQGSEKSKTSNALRSSLRGVVRRRNTQSGASPQILKKPNLEDKRKSYNDPVLYDHLQPRLGSSLKLFDSLGASLSFGASWIPKELNETGSFEVIKYPNGDIFKGPLTKEKIPNGIGEYFFANGDIYKGEFKNGGICGRGELRFVNGDIYEGEFSSKYVKKTLFFRNKRKILTKKKHKTGK